MDFAGVETGAKMSVGLEGRCNRCEIAVDSVLIKISATPPMRFALGEAALHAPCPVRKSEFRGISLSVGMRAMRFRQPLSQRRRVLGVTIAGSPADQCDRAARHRS